MAISIGDTLLTAVQSVLRVLLICFLGFALQRYKGVVGSSMRASVSRLVYLALSPALLWSTIVNALQPGHYSDLGVVPLYSMIYNWIGCAMGYVAGKLVYRPGEVFTRSHIISSVGFPNHGYIPLVVVPAVLEMNPFGRQESDSQSLSDILQGDADRGTGLVSLFICYPILATWSICFGLLTHAAEQARDAADTTNGTPSRGNDVKIEDAKSPSASETNGSVIGPSQKLELATIHPHTFSKQDHTQRNSASDAESSHVTIESMDQSVMRPERDNCGDIGPMTFGPIPTVSTHQDHTHDTLHPTSPLEDKNTKQSSNHSSETTWKDTTTISSFSTKRDVDNNSTSFNVPTGDMSLPIDDTTIHIIPDTSSCSGSDVSTQGCGGNDTAGYGRTNDTAGKGDVVKEDGRDDEHDTNVNSSETNDHVFLKELDNSSEALTPLCGNLNDSTRDRTISNLDLSSRGCTRLVTNCWQNRLVRNTVEKLYSPPIVAVGFGILCGLIGPLRNLFLSKKGSSDMAPLEPTITGAVTTLAATVVPLTLIVLGANTADQLRMVNTRLRKMVVTTVGIAKLLIMPVIGAGLVIGGVYIGLVPRDPVLIFVLLLEGCPPPATNLVIMCELAGHAQAEMSYMLFTLYLASIITMTFWIAIFINITNWLV